METIENAKTLDEVVKAVAPPKRHMNRAQRRAAEKRAGKKGRAQISAVTEAATKLDYIDLIQKFRALNKKREEENNENSDENN